jgi:protein-tyrosine phosphatase
MLDSVAMAREAEQDGIGVVCATPHIRDDHDVRIDELGERVAELQHVLDNQGVQVLIARGGEVSQLAVERLSQSQLRMVSLDGAGWILLEPAPGPIADRLPALARELAQGGTRLIIAHPERHAGADIDARLHELAACGCLLQWTADVITHIDLREGDSLVLRLAREGLVHLLASDAHSSHGGRPLKLSAGFNRLREICPSEWVAWMAEVAPTAILRGEPLKWPW